MDGEVNDPAATRPLFLPRLLLRVLEQPADAFLSSLVGRQRQKGQNWDER